MLSVPLLHHSAGDRERHRQHDDERVGEALELRGEHQTDESEREQEGQIDARARFLELTRLAGIVDAGGAGQHLFRGPFEKFEVFSLNLT